MKIMRPAILIALAIVSLSSCRKVIGTGPVVTETRSTGAFSAIEFSVPGNIRFSQSPERKIVIEAQKNILEVIETYVSGDELKVKVRNNTNIRNHEEISITVSGPDVHTIALRGSGDLQVPGDFSPSYARLSISGSGNIHVNHIDADRLNLGVSGSGNIEILNGSAATVDAGISGSGNIDVIGVEADEVTTNTSGSGTMKVYAGERLDVKISGSGDVYYKGNPSVNANISGSGKVRKL